MISTKQYMLFICIGAGLFAVLIGLKNNNGRVYGRPPAVGGLLSYYNDTYDISFDYPNTLHVFEDEINGKHVIWITPYSSTDSREKSELGVADSVKVILHTENESLEKIVDSITKDAGLSSRKYNEVMNGANATHVTYVSSFAGEEHDTIFLSCSVGALRIVEVSYVATQDERTAEIIRSIQVCKKRDGVQIKPTFVDVNAPVREVHVATDGQYWNRCLSTKLKNCFHDGGQLVIKTSNDGGVNILSASNTVLVKFKIGNFGIDYEGGGTWIDNNYFSSDVSEAKVLKVHEGHPFYSYKEIYFCGGKIFYPGEDIVSAVLDAKCLNAVELPGAIVLYPDLNEISLTDRENTAEIVQSVKDYARARADFTAKNYGEEPVFK